MNEQIYTTYLDTTGRPSIVLEKSHCSEKHSQLVYVSASDAIHAQNAL
jgi:Ribophorin I